MGVICIKSLVKAKAEPGIWMEDRPVPEIGPDASVAVLVAEAGYADQAHLVRESRRLTGGTPRRFEQLVRQDGQ